MSETACQSCTMPIESGPYCEHCTDDNGALHPFEETFERFAQWTRHREPGISDDDLRRKVLSFMASTAAWSDHPEVVKASS